LKDGIRKEIREGITKRNNKRNDHFNNCYYGFKKSSILFVVQSLYTG
jgi:hypothetical protein